jgi:signal peptide peptidase SppA
MANNPLLARFAGQPALVSPDHAARFEACLAAVAEHERAEELLSERADSGDDFWRGCDEPDSWRAFIRPYTVVDGILQIPVKGVLLNNFPYQLGSYATGYEYIWQAFKRGCSDFAIGSIKGIAIIGDSPGGMVAGCFDAVDKMVALKEQVGVPVRAFAHESAYSACYAVFTVADHIAVSRTGGVGSVGVVTSHVDLSGAYEQAGIKITFIASDPSKVEGNATEPLSADAKDRIQARIDELYGIFVSAVTRSRDVSESDLRDTLKAYCFTATQAVSNGLADSIGSLEDATAEFMAALDDPSDDDQQGDEDMSEQGTSAVDQAALDTARADGHAAGVKAGDAAAKARIGAILGSAEAEGRGDLANHFAFETDMTADAVIAALAKAPAAAAPAPVVSTDALAAMMEGSPQPNVGGGQQNSSAGAAQDDPVALAQQAGIAGFGKPKN